MIEHNTAVRTDGNINSGLFKIFITGLAYLDQRRRLTASDTLGLTGDTDGTASDSDLDKVRSAFRQIQEAFPVNHISRSYFYRISIFFTDKINGLFLPFAVSFGGIDTKHVRSRFQQSRHSLFIVAAVDACSHHIPFLRIQQFVGIAFMLIVVFPEYEIQHIALFVGYRKGIQLVIPDDIVGFT